MRWMRQLQFWMTRIICRGLIMVALQTAIVALSVAIRLMIFTIIPNKVYVLSRSGYLTQPALAVIPVMVMCWWRKLLTTSLAVKPM